MVIRFKGMPLMADHLRQVVDSQLAGLAGPTGFFEDGVHHTAFSLKKYFYVYPNGDLYIDDDFNSEITGMLLQGLRAHNYLAEKAKVIVPDKYDTDPDCEPLIEANGTLEGTNISWFEDYLSDEVFDDGKFEEEMDEAENTSPDTDEY